MEVALDPSKRRGRVVGEGGAARLQGCDAGSGGIRCEQPLDERVVDGDDEAHEPGHEEEQPGSLQRERPRADP